MKKSDYRKLLLKFIYSILMIILLFDIFMFVWVVFEPKIYNNDNKWISNSQTIIPNKLTKKNSVIMIHGFIGSPYDMKPLAIDLSQNGYKVIVPLIKGQTVSTKAYHRGSYKYDYYIEWLKKIIQKEHELTGHKPYLVGFSMGGALSSIVAKDNNIKKLVLLAPFYNIPKFGDKMWNITRFFHYITPFIPKSSNGKINDRNQYDNYKPGSFIISLEAFNNLGDLVKLARESIGKIKVDTLVFISKNDEVASYKTSINLFKNIKNIKIIEKNKSNHVLLYDYDSKDIIKELNDFLSKQH